MSLFKNIQRRIIFSGGLSSLDTIYTQTGDSSQWEQAYTTVSLQSAGWGGEFGTQGATAYTILQNSSSNWDNVYATVSSSSATWDIGGGGGTNAWSEITGTPTTLDGYGITDAVVLSNFESLENLIETNSGQWDSSYTALTTTSGDWNSTKTTVETNSGNWKSVYTDVNAKSGDWNSAYNLKHQGGSIDGDLVVNGSLTAIGPANQISTTFTTTSALCVVTLGQGPSLYVEQDTTYNNVASFVDSTTGVVLYVGRVNNVGINTDSSELSGLTVSGNISSSNIVYSLNGNSSNWNSSYTTLTSNSANWRNSYNSLTSTSSNWNSSYTTLTSNSGDWISKNNTVLSSLSVTQNVTVTGNVVASVLSASRFTGNSLTTNTQTTTNYNLLSSDNGKVLTFNNSNPITVNVLSGLGAGYSVSLIQLNTGQITISGGSGVTINSFGNVTKTAGQFAGVSLYAYIADTFCLNGALTS